VRENDDCTFLCKTLYMRLGTSRFGASPLLRAAERAFDIAGGVGVGSRVHALGACESSRGLFVMRRPDENHCIVCGRSDECAGHPSSLAVRPQGRLRCRTNTSAGEQ